MFSVRLWLIRTQGVEETSEYLESGRQEDVLCGGLAGI